jgi:hypothetical protein
MLRKSKGSTVQLRVSTKAEEWSWNHKAMEIEKTESRKVGVGRERKEMIRQGHVIWIPIETTCDVEMLALFDPMDKSAIFALSTKGLQIANRISRKDFRFICGSDALVCDRFQAAFVSPRIANCLLSDPSIDEYSMDHTDSGGIEILYKLICGDSVSITATNSEVFFGLIEDVGNSDLSCSVLDFVETNEELSV